MTSENMRREARVDVRVPVVVYRGKSALTLETSDVSFKGLFVCTDNPPPLRSLVRLEITLAHHTIRVHAMAVHVVAASETQPRAPGVGLQFWGLSGPDRTAWDDFVRGIVQARRMAAKKSAPPSAHPATTEATSGVRIVTVPNASPDKPRASFK